MTDTELQILKIPGSPSHQPVNIAVRHTHGVSADSPGVIWLGGFKSDMLGTKAAAVAGWAADKGWAATRFDYSGHGESSGDFAEGTISAWLAQSLAVFDSCTKGPQFLVGSSMGGWITLLLARAHLRAAGQAASRIKGLVLIAPAADMTGRLMWDIFTDEIRHEIMSNGYFLRPSDYGEPYQITKALIDDGAHHFILDNGMQAGCPVRILHGMQDPDVPWSLSLEIIEKLSDDDVTLTLIKDGDHRLSREDDIARLLSLLDEFA